MDATFDLVDEDWIPVVDGGTARFVSLRRALTGAHELDGLALDSPLETVAVLRQVLLSVYLDACGVARDIDDWGRRWGGGQVDAEAVNGYLDRHAARFNLFGERPFAQVAGLRTGKDETKPVSLLIAAAATGNNVPLFAARTEADPPALTCAQAARAVLAAHCWDTAAIKSGAVGDDAVKGGKTTGNPTGPLGSLGVIVPTGRNLFETILLNTPIVPHPQDGDQPQWMVDASDDDPGDNYRWPGGPAWSRRPVRGLLDLLTWQARRIRLIPERADDGHIVVRRVVLAAGDRMELLPEYEPHTAWRQVEKRKPGDPANRPIRHVPGRAAWRGMEPMLATRRHESQKVTSSELLRQLDSLRVNRMLPRDLAVQVVTVGVEYGNQSAVIEDVIADRIPLPLAALNPDGGVSQFLRQAVNQAEDIRNAANRLGDDLRQATGGEKIPWDKGQRIGDTLIIQFSPYVWRMLAGLQRLPESADEEEVIDQAEQAWQRIARNLANDAAEAALRSVPPAAFLGRARTRDPAAPNGGKDKDPVRASVAEAWFRGSVRKILGLEKAGSR
nr:type I-E CRISPR-associated protein Cse1/CasA [Micromonospora sp. DSM 115978]